jgi:uncharacterized membrane protein
MDPIAAIELVARAFGLVGVVITSYGGVVAIVQLVLRELGRTAVHYREIRISFTNRILFGLEFFIVSDLILTFTDPALEELIRLGAVVAIRTVLAYYLEREANEFPDIG